MDKQRFIRDEFIGHSVSIIDSRDPTWLHRSGVIIDETKNTFLLDINGDVKRIAKNIAIFRFKINDKEISIHGRQIMYRPEDRIKKVKVTNIWQ